MYLSKRGLVRLGTVTALYLPNLTTNCVSKSVIENRNIRIVTRSHIFVCFCLVNVWVRVSPTRKR